MASDAVAVQNLVKRLVRHSPGRQHPAATGGDLSVFAKHFGDRSVYLYDICNAAAGHDDDIFLYSAIFYAERVCVSCRQYAQGRAMADLFESAEIFFDYYPGSVFKRNRTGIPVASVCRPFDFGLDCVLGFCQPFPETVGLMAA